MSKTAFKIIVPAYNALPWLERCLQSLQALDYPHYQACVVDDASTVPGQRELITQFAEHNGWEAIYNEHNRGALANISTAIDHLACDDEDVIVILDGDDWLANEWVLQRLDEIYSNEDVWLTYGQHLRYKEGTLGCPRQLRRGIIRKRSYRKKGWVFSHLRSFKHFLWKNIRDEDLRDPEGNYFMTTSDLATMFPMAEMAGDRIRFVPEVLYIYNDTNPIGDEISKREEQLALNRYIRGLPKYKPLVRD